jgi:Ca2+/Na+ antiporter
VGPYFFHTLCIPFPEIGKRPLTFYSSNYFSVCVISVLLFLIRDLSGNITTDHLYLLLFYLLHLLLLFNYKSIEAICIYFHLITLSKIYKQIRAALSLCFFRDEPFNSSTTEG